MIRRQGNPISKFATHSAIKLREKRDKQFAVANVIYNGQK